MNPTIKQSLKRIQTFHEMYAGAESDIDATRDGLEIYQKAMREIGLRFNLQLLKDRVSGPVSLLLNATPPHPVDLTTKSMLKVDLSHFSDHKLYLVICFVPRSLASDASGVFSTNGLEGKPTIFMYIPDFDGEELGYAATARAAILRYIKTSSKLQKTFAHEFRHFLDMLASLSKNPNAKMFRKYKTSPDPVKDPQATAYGAHINQITEVNARYSEFLVSILYSFNQPSIREIGIAEAFPDFQGFWDYYWTPDYAPDGLLQFAKPAIIKYLKKRLYKFYDFVKDSEAPVPTSKFESKKRAAEYLRKDQSGN